MVYYEAVENLKNNHHFSRNVHDPLSSPVFTEFQPRLYREQLFDRAILCFVSLVLARNAGTINDKERGPASVRCCVIINNPYASLYFPSCKSDLKKKFHQEQTCIYAFIATLSLFYVYCLEYLAYEINVLVDYM